MNDLLKSPPPLVAAYSTWHQPDLIGQVCGPDGKILVDEHGGEILLDLNGGKITWHPSQSVMVSLFYSKWRKCENNLSQFRLSFRKSAGDKTAMWLCGSFNVRFRIEDVEFFITQTWTDSATGEVCFEAEGRRMAGLNHT